MKTIESSLFHKVLMPQGQDPAPHPALILLHGRGADEEDLLGLASYFDSRLLILSVRAPYPFPYSSGYMWYEFSSVGAPDPTMFSTSYEKLSVFVQDALNNYPIDGKRLFLLGFSMGTVMAYTLALTRPDIIRGVMANSGYIAEGTHLTYKWDGLANTDFFIAHGTQDPVIPLQLGRRAHDLLAGTKANITYREYPMGHQINEDSLGDLRNWFAERLT